MKHRIAYIMLAICMTSVCLHAASYSGGDGNAETPYLISSLEDFTTLTATPADWDKAFLLTVNIDLTGTTYQKALIAPDTDDATQDFQGTAFTGVFDGNHHSISNLSIANTNGIDYVGLFGRTEHATISDLELKNVLIEVTGFNSTTGAVICVGGLVGSHNGLLKGCRVSGTVTAIDSSWAVGGLTGISLGYSWKNLVITECISSVTVNGSNQAGGLTGTLWNGTISKSSASGSVSGYQFIGGLAGEMAGIIEQSSNTSEITGGSGVYYFGGLAGNSTGYLIDSYNTGTIHVYWGNYIGGLTGQMSHTITRCYNSGAVDVYGSGGAVGGLVGYNYMGFGTITDSFWDTQTSGQSSSGTDGGTGLSTSLMQQSATYTQANWDFFPEETDGSPAIWTIKNEGQDYPILAWQNSIVMEKYNGGTGDPNSPYQIASLADLMLMSQTPADWNRCFILTADIDMNGQQLNAALIAPDTDISTNTFDGTAFTGSFDGNGHTIDNL